MTAEPEGENWVFESLVNFLHGNIWKIPVMGFVEEKSVVFDPDSYNNLTDEKEEEFRKIHEEYKALVDYMLSSFMEDLQITPEQVEEACRQREKQHDHITESHITKMALEQLQAAEDFNTFRRIMTRKNIDLQLQSLELLVAKYGVLSPSLRSTEAEDNSEDDFLQVVIRYCDDSGVLDDQQSHHPPADQLGYSKHHITLLSQQLSPQGPLSSTCAPPTIDHCSNNLSKEIRILGNDAENVAATVVSAHPPQVEHAVRENNTSMPPEAQAIDASNDSCGNKEVVTSHPSHSSKNNVRVHVEVERTSSNEISSPMTFPSQLLQQEEDEGRRSNSSEEDAATKDKEDFVSTKYSTDPGKKSRNVKFQETTIAEIANVAPEQHRILTSVRKALEVDPEDEETPVELNFDGSEEEIQKRREYLRSQRDKLVALKKKEREKQLKNVTDNEENRTTRPKSARAAQMALKRSSLGNGNDKSLAARRALAQQLKHELLDK